MLVVRRPPSSPLFPYTTLFRSTHGALQEAKHVFIKSGWNEIQNSTVSVLEIGFGSGLNALLTLLNSMNDKKTVHYTGLEAYPVSSDEISALNYARLDRKSVV